MNRTLKWGKGNRSGGEKQNRPGISPRRDGRRRSVVMSQSMALQRIRCVLGWPSISRLHLGTLLSRAVVSGCLLSASLCLAQWIHTEAGYNDANYVARARAGSLRCGKKPASPVPALHTTGTLASASECTWLHFHCFQFHCNSQWRAHSQTH